MSERSPGYYAVIPASVRYDDKIPANAKLLYGEISALISAEGYCYAKNAYFADLYKLSERTVTSLISKLQEFGHIKVELERDETGQIVSRKLFLTASVTDGQPLAKNFYTPRKNFREGIENNFQYTNTSNTNIEKENIKRKNAEEKSKGQKGSPDEDFDPMPLFVAWISATFPNDVPDRKNQLYYALKRFMENRVALKKPMKTKGAVTALCNRLLRHTQKSQDKLEIMVEMLDLATENNWQSVYPRESSPPNAPSKSGRVYECL